MKSLYFLTQFDDKTWRLYFRFLRKREEYRTHNGVFIHDEATTWGDAMAIAFNRQENETKEKIDYAEFHDEMHSKYFSLRACGVKIPHVDTDTGIEIFRSFFNNPIDWIFNSKHYKGDSILDTSAIELCNHILQANSKDKDALLKFAESLNGSLDKIHSFILENYSTPTFTPYFEVLNCERLPDHTSHQGYPAAFFEPYYPYYWEETRQF